MALSTKDLQALRENYSKSTLDLDTLNSDPFLQFERWFLEAQKSEVIEPNTMVLSTIGAGAVPTSRVVLLKGFSPEGFVFYTNYSSEKGQNIAVNPNVAITFLWMEIERQVRVRGVARKVSEEQSTEYFQSRPRKSQIGAWASDQSGVVQDREVLEGKVRELDHRYKDAIFLPKPPTWGGYIIEPTYFEFWQGRRSRLHDRFRFVKNDNHTWVIDRLSP